MFLGSRCTQGIDPHGLAERTLLDRPAKRQQSMDPSPRSAENATNMLHAVDITVDHFDCSADISDLYGSVIALGRFASPRNDIQLVCGGPNSGRSVRHMDMPHGPAFNHLIDLDWVGPSTWLRAALRRASHQAINVGMISSRGLASSATRTRQSGIC